MRLQLIVDVPATADRDEVLQQLALSQASGHGITITTSWRYAVDVDLVLFEQQGVAAGEGLSL